MTKAEHDLDLGPPTGRAGLQPPLVRFLNHWRSEFAADTSGAVADYIPELTTANPNHFGISLATIDGHVYEVGDSGVAFTIQSISKAFVFALALETVGAERVEATIGVEPSGDAFNSIRLRPDNRPFNPMVNSGAIACSGLICRAEGDGAFERILDALSRFAGRRLAVDESVFASERATGDRNRAIAYLLRNYAVVEGDVDAVLDVYFRQCSILVTARDLAVMAATLASGGINPVSGEQVVTPYAVARTLSVMTSSGMYDYAGEWIYRVGIPAKSGVGGGIIAALPSQLGLGTFSPLLDSHGNSVRGLKVCEALSAHFDLHVLNRSGDVRSCIIADYDIGGISSRRNRLPHEQQLLEEHHEDIRIIELVGALTFATIDYVSRQLAARPRAQLLVLDFHRVPTITEAAARLLAESLRDLGARGMTAIFSGLDQSSPLWEVVRPWVEDLPKVRRFALLDDAIEWAEDQVIYRYGGYVNLKEATDLSDQALLRGLPAEDIDELAALATPRTFEAGQRIITIGEPATSLFFLQSGMVSVKLPSGVRLASMSQGMEFGEMALLEERRTADVWADTFVACLELPRDQINRFCQEHPQSGQRIVHNLAALLAKRLILANTKIDLLTAY
ncbi:MAG TPA: glutaminase A [Xanthobacteraceae bacterium]